MGSPFTGAAIDLDGTVYRGDRPVADADGGIATATEHGCQVVAVEQELCFDGELVETAHDVGLDVWAGTVTDRPTARPLEATGVGGLIAERADGR